MYCWKKSTLVIFSLISCKNQNVHDVGYEEIYRNCHGVCCPWYSNIVKNKDTLRVIKNFNV